MIAEQRRHALVGIDRPPQHINEPDALTGGLDDTTEALLTGAKLGFQLLALGDVVEANDRADDLATLVSERFWMGDDDLARSIGALDENLSLALCQRFAAQDPGHGTLVMGHEAAIWIEDPVRATVAFAGIIALWRPSP